LLGRRGIETVILAGADTHGIMRGKRVPIAELDHVVERGVALCEVIWALPVDEVEPTMRHFLRGLVEGMAARVEHRQAGADANPYLAAAAALAAGLDGVRRACEPPPHVDGDVYTLSDGAAPPLPATLGEATGLLERSALARDWLGDDVVEHCVAMRRSELAAQAAAVTDWETARYLEAL
jgi:glutamine synthetase